MTVSITAQASPIKTELIPKTAAESMGQTALDSFLRFKVYLRKHPDEERRFQARVAEVKKRCGLQ